MTRRPLLTDDTPPAYLLRRVADSEADAIRAEREARELDAIQRKRGQKRPRRTRNDGPRNSH